MFDYIVFFSKYFIYNYSILINFYKKNLLNLFLDSILSKRIFARWIVIHFHISFIKKMYKNEIYYLKILIIKNLYIILLYSILRVNLNEKLNKCIR